MNKFTKIAAGTVAALTITVGALASSSTEAHAWGKKGWGGPAIGFGIAAGIIGAATYAATAPTYVVPAYDCRLVERYDRFGNYRGTMKVCD